MKIVFTPDWFLNGDVLIEFFSFVVLVSFFLICVRNYKLNKNRNVLYLGIGFLFIAIAELATIFTKIILYYDTSITQNIGQMIVTYQVVNSIDVFYYIGFFFHKLFTLVGFYFLYRLPMKKDATSIPRDVIIAVCFFLVSALFSSAFYYLFHITALLLLVLIINNYMRVYKKNRSENTKILLIAFSMLALSQAIFILSKLNVLYVMGQALQLVSYLMLLVLIIKIQRAPKSQRKSL